MQVVLPSVELISLISDRVSFDFVIEVKVDNPNKITSWDGVVNMVIVSN